MVVANKNLVVVKARTLWSDPSDLRVREFDARVNTADVTGAFVQEFGLPDNMGWQIRTSDGTTLNDLLPIGEQGADELIGTITPRTHLGG